MRTDAIVHLFDWPFARCEAALPALAAQGFGAIQISPPQRSLDRPEWWARYQPVDHTVLDGPLGNEADLRRLTAAAHALGLKVLVDVVLNHMASDSPHARTLHYPRFGPEHFHPRQKVDYNDLESIRRGWVVGLPDLATELPYVRAEGRRYLDLLVSCGADGFRFDAVKHMEPAYFEAVLAGLPAQLFHYGEYIAQPGHFPVMKAFLPQMRLMDFPLHQTMAEALGPGGDLAQLDAPAEPQALPDGTGLAFVTNHDLELAQYGGFGLPPDSLALAHAYTTCRLQSVPLVWMEHLDDPVLRAALRLRALAAQGGGWRTLRASRQLLVWRSVDGRALLVLNAAPAPRHVEASWLDGGPGAGVEPADRGWIDLTTGESLGDGDGIVPARQCGLFALFGQFGLCASLGRQSEQQHPVR